MHLRRRTDGNTDASSGADSCHDGHGDCDPDRYAVFDHDRHAVPGDDGADTDGDLGRL